MPHRTTEPNRAQPSPKARSDRTEPTEPPSLYTKRLGLGLGQMPTRTTDRAQAHGRS